MSKDLPTSAGRETLLTGENKLHQSHISTNIKKEAVILGVLLFNGFLLPSYLSLSYMTFSMTLMIMFSKSETSPIVAKIKKWVSLLMLLVSAVALAVSFYYLISIPVDVKKNLTPDQIRFYISIGISFNQDQSAVNTFVTFLPKIVSMILAYNLVNIYKQNQEDKQQRVCHLTLDLKSRLLNIAVVMICFASCVVQSVVQLFLFSKKLYLSLASRVCLLDGLQLQLGQVHQNYLVDHQPVLPDLLHLLPACLPLHRAAAAP